MHGDYRKSTRDTSDPKTSPFGALREELHREQTDFITALCLLEDAPAHLRAQMASYMLADRAMARWENTPVKLGARDEDWEEALGSWANGLYFLEYGGEHAKGLRLILREHERYDALPRHVPERCVGRLARAKRALSQTLSHPPDDIPIWTMRATWPASLDAFLIARMVGSFER